MKRFGLGLIVIGLLVGTLGMTALGGAHDLLTVDGQEYAPSQVSGPVFHYETPDTDPQVAFTARNTWTGNGSEHLPCEFGIHWIDNANVLTVSHCLEGETTTTTSDPEETTTTDPETTTTASETTTTVPETTTTDPETTTTIPETTTDPVTTVPTTTPSELPDTGADVSSFVVAGLALLMSGGLILLGITRRAENI